MTEDAAKTDLPDILKILKNAFKKAPFPDIKTRQQDLKTLKALLLDNQDAFIQAMDQDFGNRSSDDPRLDKHLQGIAVVLKSLVVRYMLMDWIGWLCPATTQFTTTQTRTRARAYACTRTD